MNHCIRKIDSRTTPLCWLPDGKLVCYKEGFVKVYNKGEVVLHIPVFSKKKEHILAKSKMLYRGMRMGVRASIALNGSIVLLSKGSYIYELSLTTRVLSKGFFLGNGVRPLIYSEVNNVEGFDSGIYFGGYLSNNNKNSVNIYKRISEDNWEVIYTFSNGSINHVHNIVVDSFRNCLWIFTGDFDDASAIWKVTDNFRKVERVVCNNQKYRGCVAYALPEGLLYATDAPFADDFIYLMNTDTFELKEILPIHGSCIYGCQWKDKYVFSSTVEGDGRNMSRWEFLFGRKRGAGIKDDYVHMYIGNLKEGFKEIYKEKKDCMPFYTFQFGVFKFPYGINNGDVLYFQPVATKINDQGLMAYSE